jgi:methionyl-tRNA formyltransferase
VERAILAGDRVTGVCLMRLEEGLDTGPVLARREVAMDDDHASVLRERLSQAGADLLVELLGHGVGALGPGQPQSGEPTYAAKIDPAELRLVWSAPAEELHRVVRLDAAWTTFRGRRLRVLEARPDAARGEGPPGALHGSTVTTGSGVLELESVQPEGKRPMPADAWRNGVRPAPGELLGAQSDDR